MNTTQRKQDGALVEREIVITRLIDATPQEVYAALTDPEQIGTWWGPDGFRTTTQSMDVRPGGAWIFTMHGPDGTDWPNAVVYRIVEPGRRLVYDHGETVDKAHFLATITLTARGDQTEIELRTVFPTKQARDHVVREVNAIEGGQQTLARLAAHLAKTKGS